MTTETQVPADESRLSVIEAVLPHLATKEEVAKISAVIPHLATKEDVAKLETKLVETNNEMLRWTIGSIATATTILGLLITLTR
ncbi:MAG: hypothetical protein F4X34_00390 [Chloroflexi bacterium]|nr:hypothetical protein [Chloroflexota bacterium]